MYFYKSHNGSGHICQNIESHAASNNAPLIFLFLPGFAKGGPAAWFSSDFCTAVMGHYPVGTSLMIPIVYRLGTL